MHRAIFNMDNRQDLLHHREACSALGAAGMAGGSGERGYEDVYGRVPLLLP